MKRGEGNEGRKNQERKKSINPPKKTRWRTKTHKKKPNKWKGQCKVGNNSKYVYVDGILNCEFIS